MIIDPITDMLVFKGEPDAPAEANIYPEMETHFASTVGFLPPREEEKPDSQEMDWGNTEQTLFVDQEDAPTEAGVYPEVEIHFSSTVGKTENTTSVDQEIDMSFGSYVDSSGAELGEREIYLTYEFENAHAEPLPTEKFSVNYSERDGGSASDGAVYFITDSIEAGDESLEGHKVEDLSGGSERQEEGSLPDIPILTMPDEDDENAEFVGMDSFIYTVIDDGSSVRAGTSTGDAAVDVAGGMIWSIETDDFAGLSDHAEAPLGDIDMSLATTEVWDSASDWFLA